MKNFILFAIVSITGAFGQTPSVTVSQGASSLGRYEVYELTMTHSGSYANPWTDVTVACKFNAPSGQQVTVAGFYYDTKIWKCRFAPREVGNYSWNLSFSNGSGTFTATGSFTSNTSSRSGFVRLHPTNKYRLITEGDNRLFFGIGVEETYDDFMTTPPYPQPPGVNYATKDGKPDFTLSYSENPVPCYTETGAPMGNCTYSIVSADTYFSTYRAAGANLYRSNGEAPASHEIQDFNNSNSGAGKFTTRLDFGKMQDQVAQAANNYDIHLVWTPMYRPQDFIGSAWDLSNANVRSAFLGYWQYVIARYGAYVDIWELANEEPATEAFITTVGQAITAADPYKHLISPGGTTNSLNSNAQVNGPHMYWNVSTLNLDSEYVGGTYGMANLKTNYPNRPFFWGEAGDYCPDGQADDESRIRTYLWVGLMYQSSGSVFWNNDSYGACGSRSGIANFYFGPQVRAYSKVFASYIKDLDPAATQISVTSSSNVRGYGMASGSDVAAYFLHTNTRSSSISGATVSINVPAAGLTGQWIDPASGNVISTFSPGQGTQTLTIPPFTADIALRIKGAGSTQPPVVSRCDLDNDGNVGNSDVQIAINQALATAACASADLDGNGRCDVVDVQRVVNASLGGNCRVGP